MSLYVLNQYAVFQAPRTGSTSLRKFHARKEGYDTLHQQTLEDIRRTAPDILKEHIEALPKINVVRNSWERAISCYNFFGTDFYSFVEYLKKVQYFWQFSKEVYARVPNKQIDWYVPDAEIVLTKDLSERFPGVPHINKSEKEITTFDKAYKDQEAIDLVAEMYKEDIETFGFEFRG